MNRQLLATIILSSCLAASACDDSERTESGPELLQPFKQQLQQALKSGMEDGPAQAIEACRTKAPDIAAGLSIQGARMGRTSHRLRNPDNAAPPWVQPVLDAYLKPGVDPVPKTVSLEGKYRGYVEPIMTQPLCLACHGEALAPELETKLANLYPEDQARGFGVGDLRGVFWVEYPASR